MTSKNTRTIRVDNQVYAFIEAKRLPGESVTACLRRLLKLNDPSL